MRRRHNDHLVIHKSALCILNWITARLIGHKGDLAFHRNTRTGTSSIKAATFCSSALQPVKQLELRPNDFTQASFATFFAANGQAM